MALGKDKYVQLELARHCVPMGAREGEGRRTWALKERKEKVHWGVLEHQRCHRPNTDCLLL